MGRTQASGLGTMYILVPFARGLCAPGDDWVQRDSLYHSRDVSRPTEPGSEKHIVVCSELKGEVERFVVMLVLRLLLLTLCCSQVQTLHDIRDTTIDLPVSATKTRFPVSCSRRPTTFMLTQVLSGLSSAPAWRHDQRQSPPRSRSYLQDPPRDRFCQPKSPW